MTKIGYSSEYGARPLKRAIQTEIQNLLANKLIAGEIKPHDKINIDYNGKIIIEGTPDELMQKAGGQEIIYVKIKGNKEAVLTKLKTMENVETVSEIPLKIMRWHRLLHLDLWPRSLP